MYGSNSCKRRPSWTELLYGFTWLGIRHTNVTPPSFFPPRPKNSAPPILPQTACWMHQPSTPTVLTEKKKKRNRIRSRLHNTTSIIVTANPKWLTHIAAFAWKHVVCALFRELTPSFQMKKGFCSLVSFICIFCSIISFSTCCPLSLLLSTSDKPFLLFYFPVPWRRNSLLISSVGCEIVSVSWLGGNVLTQT